MSSPASSSFAYVTCIRTTPERLWFALIDAEFMKQYWFGMYAETDWKVGSTWKRFFPDGRVADTGAVVACDPPNRLVVTWRHEVRPELKDEGHSRCTMELKPTAGAVKLTITHEMARPQSHLIQAVSVGWPQVLSNLKSILETGSIALETPEPKKG